MPAWQVRDGCSRMVFPLPNSLEYTNVISAHMWLHFTIFPLGFSEAIAINWHASMSFYHGRQCHAMKMGLDRSVTSLCFSFHFYKIRGPRKTISNVSLNLSYVFFICIQDIVLIKLQMANFNFFFIFSQYLI